MLARCARLKVVCTLCPARTAGGGGGSGSGGQARASFGNFFTDDTIGIKVSPVRHEDFLLRVTLSGLAVRLLSSAHRSESSEAAADCGDGDEPGLHLLRHPLAHHRQGAPEHACAASRTVLTYAICPANWAVCCADPRCVRRGCAVPAKGVAAFQPFCTEQCSRLVVLGEATRLPQQQDVAATLQLCHCGSGA